ncbi:alkaline phosphatase [Bacillus sp. AFS002410]|uniref:DedA family protein n=1 Tax=Bacillus sp. AFS002410 TaxID=2033481 RepID=UPI000BF23577|nr:DedA family protein [Bacillus sp. AFS002410]PEJ52126.1 alkaline phosphatase [Bacillus sp. AFS002410]
MVHHLNGLINHYGYLGIILALIGGIIGLPLPDEILLIYIGYNVFQGRLSYIPSIACAIIGIICGISLSYLLGYMFGLPLLNKYGPKVHITEKKIEFTKSLFAKFGPYILIIGFFIPGVRHLTAYFAAINKYSYKKFSMYAFVGAILWGFTFITLGKIFGEEWDKVASIFARYSLVIFPSALLIAAIFYFVWRKRLSPN